MNFIISGLAWLATTILGPIDGWKTWIGLGVAVIVWGARSAGVEVPVIDVNSGGLDVLYTLLAVFGLHDKTRKGVV